MVAGGKGLFTPRCADARVLVVRSRSDVLKDAVLSCSDTMTAVAAWSFTALTASVAGWLEPQQPVQLHHERAVLEPTHRRRRRHAIIRRVAFVGVDQKQLAPRRVLPPEAKIGTNALSAELYCSSPLANISGVNP